MAIISAVDISMADISVTDISAAEVSAADISVVDISVTRLKGFSQKRGRILLKNEEIEKNMEYI